MKLLEILQGVEVLFTACDPEVEISDICYDSRKAKAGSLFVAIKGFALDGNSFIPSAIEAGAAAVITDSPGEGLDGIPHIVVADARKALAQASARFFGMPQQSLKIIGVTGTNGKTTVASLVASIIEEAGHKCGLIGTTGISITGQRLAADRTTPTTPESYDLFKYLAQMASQGCGYAVMEVSSHALALCRVWGIEFEVAVFTNLTQDHLEFHRDAEDYFQAKAKLFDWCKIAVINYDDEHGQRLIDSVGCPKITYSAEDNDADVVAKNVKLKPQGVEFEALTTGSISRVSLAIPGLFSVYNALAAAGCGLALEIGLDTTSRALAKVSGIMGRAEIVPVPADFTVMIDYAHTPDAMENILKAVGGFCDGRIIGLFGCGGDRDKTKRPLMGQIAAKYCDAVVITSDNPRSEPPRSIIDDIIPGTCGADVPTHIITDRRQAIAFALRNADPGDVVVLMGKGHETYQEVGGKKLHLDEREVVADYFAVNREGA